MKVKNLLFFLTIILVSSACVSKKEFLSLQALYDKNKINLEDSETKAFRLAKELDDCERALAQLKKEKSTTETFKDDKVKTLEDQVTYLKSQLDKQSFQMDKLTVLSTEANQNIKETLTQMESRDKYIRHLQAAKNRADSINLALSFNLKSVLKDGIDDQDVEVKVDKTVVFINLSDKMLYQSGSAKITSRAREVLGKIAKIIENRPDLEVMVEGNTDNVPIKNSCTQDNWDLSVARATSVVRTLQTEYGVAPNRLIAAGRGEYNPIASNDTSTDRSLNRRTRIIILPKLDQFYDLLKPVEFQD